MKQYGLFPGKISTSKKNSKLVISKSKNKILSKEQTFFNRYSAKIEALRKQLKNDELKYNNLSTYFLTNLLPAHESYANTLLDFVKALFAIYQNDKLSKTHKGKLKKLIRVNLNDAFQYVTPTDEVKAIYDRFSETSYDEEEAAQFNMMKESLGDMFSDMFGVDVDLSDFDKNMTPEEIARKMAELKETFEKQAPEEDQQEKKKKKSKRELNLEIQQKQEEELQKKNIRTIYTSLAKILHPDLETDEQAKLEKEELMKRVTNAYHAKDMHELLKLEIEIIHQQSGNLDHLTDEKLKIINSVLKEQVNEIQDEIEMLQHHPKYEQISNFMFHPEVHAIQGMKDKAEALIGAKSDIIFDVEQLTGNDRIKFLTEMLKPAPQNVFMGDLSDEFDLDDKDIANIMNSMFSKLTSTTKTPKKKK